MPTIVSASLAKKIGRASPIIIGRIAPDRRSLGVYIQALTIDDGFGTPVIVSMDDPYLSVGFHAVERTAMPFGGGPPAALSCPRACGMA